MWPRVESSSVDAEILHQRLFVVGVGPTIHQRLLDPGRECRDHFDLGLTPQLSGWGRIRKHELLQTLRLADCELGSQYSAPRMTQHIVLLQAEMGDEAFELFDEQVDGPEGGGFVL